MPNALCAANVQDCREEAEMSNKKITILYSRLSRDDELQGPSNSIVNQQQLLEEYAERNGLVPYIHICDDGWSGTRWDRPGWQELIAKVEADEVLCIVVKDGTRWGLDYLRVGLYREMFREKGVRLIAINDGLDSANGDDDFTPFREIMAEYYARDTSRKIKSILAAKGKAGKPLANTPPYGYAKDPDDKNKWLVDPVAAAVVKRIFEMTIDGMGPRVIATKLHDEKVERPSYYLAQKGVGCYKNACDTEHPYSWSCSTIIQILARMEYAGHTVNFKLEKASFKSKKSTPRPKEDWIIFENTHEPIVTQEMWELVQKLRETKRRSDSLGEANPLTGLLYCADCGGKMFNHRQKRDRKGNKEYQKKPKNNYVCSTHKRTSVKYNAKCSPHIIRTSLVQEIILEILRDTSGYVQKNEAEFLQHVRDKSAVKQGETARAYAKQIAKNERRIADLDQVYKNLYEDKALHKIDEARFMQMSSGYEREQIELKGQTAALQAELDEFNSNSVCADKFVELVHRFTNFEELTPAMLNSFVDKIIVHEAEWSDGRNPETGRGLGKRIQKVEVFLKYIGAFDVPDMRTSEEIEAERIKQERIDRERAYKREYGRRKRKIAA